MASKHEMDMQEQQVVAMAKDLGRRDADAYFEEHDERLWPGDNLDDHRVTIENDRGFRAVWDEIAEALCPAGDDSIKSRLYELAWESYRHEYLS